jgi:hypothetical protein
MKAINSYSLTFFLVLAFFLIPVMVWAMGKTKDMPGAEGKDFLSYITEANPYQDWELWPGTEKMYEGTEPHGVRLTTYVNMQALKGIEEGMLEKGMPYGSIIVKENYSAEEELMAVTSMYKLKGFNPEAGDWFWIQHAADKKIMAAGKVEMCIGCHRQVEHRDYLFIKAHE